MASHGKRCQQSPFRGEPYCWHHLQSRKVPAPSRPLRVAPPPNELITDEINLPSIDRMTLAVRLAHALGEDELKEIVRFTEERRDGTLVILKEHGRIADVRTHRSRGHEARHAAG